VRFVKEESWPYNDLTNLTRTDLPNRLQDELYRANIVVMSPVLLTSAAVLSDERDPIWVAILASPIGENDLTDEQRAALEEGLEDIRAGRVVSRDHVLETIEQMRREQGE
jgi:predicted transcriptional regulator